jgi:Mrp family chromosome partitioning ATPase
MAMTALGGIAAALGLAFLIEFYLDKSIKRPVEVPSKLNLPLFISIPRLGLGNHHAKKNGKPTGLLAEHSAVASSAGDTASKGSAVARVPNSSNGSPAHNTEIAPWDPRHILRPFCEALRDRLITFFDLNNLTHKPKLVAVTSCSQGAGVSTVATGLAASLSETGEGNVLLVNMGEKHGGVHQFYKGDLACGLDEVLEKKNRENALVQDNLYVVSEATDGNGLPLPLPRRFKHLMPKLRASDYDYIIFDMPAVSQVSATPRLARFMDFVVLVVEAESTSRDVVKQACSLLGETKTNVGVVLNKGHNYLPKWLNQEL